MFCERMRRGFYFEPSTDICSKYRLQLSKQTGIYKYNRHHYTEHATSEKYNDTKLKQGGELNTKDESESGINCLDQTAMSDTEALFTKSKKCQPVDTEIS